MKLNAKAAKALRKEANFDPSTKHPGYPFPGIHHLAPIPQYEMWTRTVRYYDPKQKKIVTKTVRKILYAIDGKTPRSPQYEEYTIQEGPHMGEKALRPRFSLEPVTKPVYISIKCPKGMYRLLKKLYKKTTDGDIDTALRNLEAGAKAKAPA